MAYRHASPAWQSVPETEVGSDRIAELINGKSSAKELLTLDPR